MISICIPTFNFDIIELVTVLYHQAKKLNYQIEIIIIDDCSNEIFKKKNKKVCENYGKYIELNKNIGRAKIRNLFLKHTKFDYLLFLDCDSLIVSDSFLSRYVNTLNKKNNKVICGGRIYSKQAPARQQLLRWKYGLFKESKSADIRQIIPNKSFLTNNFIVHREIFEKIRFDERITLYGHEDTLYGFQLKQYKINIKHIDNPVLHGYLENNIEFIKKTELALMNLIHILDFVDNDKNFITDVTILNFYEKCKKKNVTSIIALLFSLLKPLLKILLSKGVANLYLFDLYKIGFFSINYKRHTKGR